MSAEIFNLDDYRSPEAQPSWTDRASCIVESVRYTLGIEERPDADQESFVEDESRSVVKRALGTVAATAVNLPRNIRNCW